MVDLKRKLDALRAESELKRSKKNLIEDAESDVSSEELAEDGSEGIFIPDSPSPEPAVQDTAATPAVASSSSRPSFAPARKTWKKTASSYISRQTIDVSKALRDDYAASIKPSQRYSRSDAQTLAYVRTLIQDFIKEALTSGGVTSSKIMKIQSELREEIMKLPFHQFLTKVLVVKSKIAADDGLPQIFEGPNSRLFPYDLQDDAYAVWLRFARGDVDPDLLRGVIPTKGQIAGKEGKKDLKRTMYKLSKDFSGKKPADFFGDNDLVNGQWWPNRICAMRDGAHGELEAGISGKTDEGAHSVVIAAGGYADEDRGDIVLYCGTESSTAKPTRSTSHLELSYKNDKPIRVLRAANKKNAFAPNVGIRYDGLYHVTDKEVLNAATSMFRFTLERLDEQHPIRYQGSFVRPNKYEVQQYEKIWALIGKMAYE